MVSLRELCKQVATGIDSASFLHNLQHTDILRSISDGVVVVDETGYLAFFNPMAEQLLGIQRSESDPDGWSSTNEVFCADGKTFCPRDQQPLSLALRRQSIIESELVIDDSSIGEPRRVCARAAPIFDRQNVLAGGVATLYDITERHNAEQRTRREADRLERLNKELERLSHTDTLTGIPSRRAFDKELGSRMHQHVRNGEAITLLIADVDYFKSINDRDGHLAGDTVLRQLATILVKLKPLGAFAARIGGEEFGMLFSHGSLDQVSSQAEALRQRVQEASFYFQGKRIDVTVSIGITQVVPGDDSRSVFLRSDVALYAAKNSGRNRVFVSDCCGVCHSVTDELQRTSPSEEYTNRRLSKRHKVETEIQNVIVHLNDVELGATLNDESEGGISLMLPQAPNLELGTQVSISRNDDTRRAEVRNMGIASEGIWRLGLAWIKDERPN